MERDSDETNPDSPMGNVNDVPVANDSLGEFFMAVAE
jgi:hypothetical protein